ncbi:expressed unknown protein [Seminavis robusta]|uniref:Uncharacterized protein n=1 Tax=Seminavis robusta TaxID=568900 RepID=A0A9N8E7A6_9STRA|nr:expressed unknown protein [Seminavis robusta]|eukprot:Sro757_g197960.1 n/a (340) ;mRNA; f:33213-34232
MCWSFKVSMVFALLEASSTFYLYQRAKKSTDPYIRAQLWVVPLLITIFLVEITEAFVWLDPTLLPVTAQEGPPCSAYNRNLTMVFWFLVYPWQPLLCTIPCRRVGHPRNRDIFAGIEIVAIALPIWHIMIYILEITPHLLDEHYNPPPPRFDIQRQAYQTFQNSETCTYVGQNGHLFWTLATATSWLSPNGTCYIILFSSFILCKPKRFFAGMALFMSALALCLNTYYRGSMEMASMWCWLGMLMHIYFILQPYLLPCNDNNSYSADTFAANAGFRDELPVVEIAKCNGGGSCMSQSWPGGKSQWFRKLAHKMPPWASEVVYFLTSSTCKDVAVSHKGS